MRQRRVFEDKLGLAETDAYDTPCPLEEEPEETPADGLAEDYKIVKKQLKKSIKTNQEIIDIILEELKAEPTPRMAEVAARLLETLSNSGVQILQASKTVAEIYKISKEEMPKEAQPQQVIKNAIFVGKLEDVFKLQDIQKQQKALEALTDAYE